MSRLRSARPQARSGVSDWYRIRNLADDTAEVVIYDEISWWGVSAQQFLKELRDISASQITLRLNSPGGDVFDGIAIYNLLRSHPAQVTTYVDSLAASIASVIALAGDKVVMQPHSQFMIHDAWGMCIGNAADMTEMATQLGRHSDNIAAIYADKAGGTVAEWRERMTAETWFTADEAVAAGLADEVREHQRAADAAPVPQASWDLTMFRYAGREHAPAPAARAALQTPPAEPAAGPTDQEEDIVSTLNEGLRERLGIASDAELDDDALLAALNEALAERAEPPAPEPVPAPVQESVAARLPEGTVLIEQAVLDDLRGKAALGALAHERQVNEDRDRALDEAIKAGKFPPARREHYARMWDVDPEGARQVLASLAEGTVPLADLGEPGGEPDQSGDNAFYDRIFTTPGA
ncbi:head maturation protease, ClpP-related [Nonomuraea sp. NPDC050310]|uniref:head maturation protease, ClpP-related n=1 Tax=Nonomuraea sp. NPDC050310 TaxID=3154935 RepID=UPI0033FCF3C8